MHPILEITHVDQVFRTGFWMNRTQALHDVSLSVPARSIFGFLGANGAGKTTLIQLITGLKRPVRGTVRIAGHEASTPNARSRIGYLPERPYFHEHLTGQGLLEYFGVLSGMTRSRIDARISEVLSIVGMRDARKIELKHYSKGMLQRIGIAQAILHDPEFLVLDEPMSGLDPIGRKEIRELIVKLASEGRTVFFSTHVIPDVEAICDQVGLIEKGRLIGSGPIRKFLGRGPVQVEVAFSGIPESDAQRIPHLESARAIPEGTRAILPNEDAVEPVLREILAARGKVLWVTPIRPSLEEFLTSKK